MKEGIIFVCICSMIYLFQECGSEWVLSSQSYELVRNISRQLQWANGFGYGLNNIHHVINTFIDLPILECIWNCVARPRCVGFEYKTQLKFCKLMSNYTMKERRPGYVAVTGFETLTSGVQTYSINESCVVSTLTGQLTCQIADCGYPPTEEYILGNQYMVGSNLFHHHGTRLRHLTCAENGQWEFGQVSCYPGVTCGDIRKYRSEIMPGVYTNRFELQIYCEFKAEESWLVFQRRQDGSVNFYRAWNDYKNGFGDLSGEFWLDRHGKMGRNKRLDAQGQHVEPAHFEERRPYLCLQLSLQWRCKSGDKISWNDGDHGSNNLNDSLSVHNGMMFSTQDQDNDDAPVDNCAVQYPGGWWYKACVYGALNGIYYIQGATISPPGSGIIWKTWVDSYSSLKSTTMKMRNNH